MKKFACLFLLFCSQALHAAVYECFLFYNEFDMVRCQIEELKDVVDYFVIQESVETFQGGLKPLYFEENKHLFADYEDRIIYLPLREKQKTTYYSGGLIKNAWDREQYQRTKFSDALKDIAGPGDVFIWTDADEIPKKETVEFLVGKVQEDPSQAYLLTVQGYNFYINRMGAPWRGPVIASYEWCSSTTNSGVNLHRKRMIPRSNWIEDAGWHFSSLGGPEVYAKKLESFSHSEANTDENKSYEGWEREKNARKLVPIDSTFPQYIQDHVMEFIDKGLIEPW